MNRNLITQIKNEGRDNLWLIIEFMIVAVVVWILSLSLYSMLRTKYGETGYDITDVYQMKLRIMDKENSKYDENADNDDDIRTIIANIRRSPYVEVAGLSNNALPYHYSYIGNSPHFINLPDTVRFHGNTRSGSPEMVRVLRIKGLDGYTAEELEASLRKGDILISNAQEGYYTGVSDVKDLIGQEVYLGDTVHVRHIAGLIATMRRNEFEGSGSTIFRPIDENDLSNVGIWEIAVRVKPGMGKKFEDEYYATPEMRQMRNVYLAQLKSMENVRAVNQSSHESTLRLYCAGIVFLLIIIFLGLLGTFWFRIRQRTGEIALRKTCGATSADIFRRIIGEGMLLLCTALIPALIIGTGVIYYAFNDEELSFFKIDWWPAAIAFGITACLMSLIIIIGVLVPARRAMTIEPAVALKEE